jgi:cystine transport system substrate-binding protein
MNIRSLLHPNTAILLGLLTCLTMNTAVAETDDSLSKLRQSGVVRVANTQTSPPWSFIDEQNQPTGYDVVVAREIFKRIGIPKVEFVADKFTSFVDSIKTHKYDTVINSLANTPERAKIVDFTSPYSVQAFRIWVSERNDDIHDIPSLKGHSVGATSGTSNELWARNNLKESEIRTYEGAGLLYSDLVSGRLDSLIDSYFHGQKVKEANGLPVKVVGEPVTYSLGAAIVPKGADALREAMNKAIADMTADGTLQKLGKQYLGADYDVVGDMTKAKAW